MKILYLLHQFFPESTTGTERIFFQLATQMQRYGHSVRVLSYSYAPASAFSRRSRGHRWNDISYQGLPIRTFRRRKLPDAHEAQLQDAALAEAAGEMLTAEKPDLVHAGHLMRTYELAKVALDLGIPLLCTLTDYFAICPRYTLLNVGDQICAGPNRGQTCISDCGFAQAPSRFEQLEAMLAKSQVTALSDFQAAQLQAAMPALELEVISPAIPAAPRAPPTRSKRLGDRRVIGFAGSLNRHKGVDRLIRAFLSVPGEQLELHLFGGWAQDPDYQAELQQLSARDSRIRWQGSYPPEETQTVLNRLDAICIPSTWYETHSLILHEALMQGLPVIAPRMGVFAEKVEHGRTGLLYEPDDPQGLASALAAFTAAPDRFRAAEPVSPFDQPAVEAYRYHQLYLKATHSRAPARNRAA
jgi:glycosyltransferase involved in cell wall biosynthesis